MKKEKYVIHNGVKMPDWMPDVINDAQNTHIYKIDEKIYNRIKHHSEESCPKCFVKKDQYHVPGCHVEKCPCCQLMLTECNCNWEYEESPYS